MIECQPYAYQVGIISAICDFINSWMARHRLGRIVVDGSWESGTGQSSRACSSIKNSPSNQVYKNMSKTRAKDDSAVCDGMMPSSEVGVAQLPAKRGHSECENDSDSSSSSLEYEEIDRYVSTINSTEMVLDIVSNKAEYNRELGKLNIIKSEDDKDCSDGGAEAEDSSMGTALPGSQELNDIESPEAEGKRKRHRKSAPQTDASLDQSTSKSADAKERRRVQLAIVDGSSESLSTANVERVECGGKIKFQCPECKNLFSRYTHLQRHMRLHYGERFTCPVCSQPFSRPEHVKRHVLRNHGEEFLPVPQLYECTLCVEKFKKVDALEKHMRVEHAYVDANMSVENGTGPATEFKTPRSKTRALHECSFCNESFRTINKLQSHLTKQHNYKQFMCSECGQRFTRPDHLQRHMALHTGAKPYMCNQCGQQFYRADHLRRHVRLHVEQAARDAVTAATAGAVPDGDSAFTLASPSVAVSSDDERADCMWPPSVEGPLVMDLSSSGPCSAKIDSCANKASYSSGVSETGEACAKMGVVEFAGVEVKDEPL